MLTVKNQEYFKNKKITVVGLARSGLACANLLYELEAEVSITDCNDNDSIRFNLEKLKPKNIRSELGRHTQQFIKGKDLVVVSPGIPDTALPIIWAGQFNIPVISEIEVAWVLCPATVIAITGSNGKTTVTTLVAKALEAKAKKVFLCGNIGNPFSGEVSKMKGDDFVSLEVSSFQLGKIQRFKPKISVVLNFSRNHLDRYNNMQEYLEAKKRIFMNQDKDDYLVLNYEDLRVRELAKEAKAKVVYFCREETRTLNPNQSAVLAIASILGIGRESVFGVFEEFKGIEHRLEFVAEINKIKFINDSKATTVDSTLWALKNIAEPVILIAGGRDKGSDYSAISDLMQKKAKEAILIGEAKDKIKEALMGGLPIHEVSTLEEAVSLAFSKAKPGDCVLLSPMCSSFDMFSSYEERGEVFKKAVYELAKNRVSLK